MTKNFIAVSLSRLYTQTHSSPPLPPGEGCVSGHLVYQGREVLLLFLTLPTAASTSSTMHLCGASAAQPGNQKLLKMQVLEPLTGLTNSYEDFGNIIFPLLKSRETGQEFHEVLHQGTCIRMRLVLNWAVKTEKTFQYFLICKAKDPCKRAAAQEWNAAV